METEYYAHTILQNSRWSPKHMSVQPSWGKKGTRKINPSMPNLWWCTRTSQKLCTPRWPSQCLLLSLCSETAVVFPPRSLSPLLLAVQYFSESVATVFGHFSVFPDVTESRSSGCEQPFPGHCCPCRKRWLLPQKQSQKASTTLRQFCYQKFPRLN